MKVKILHNAYIDDLEKEVNEFIEEIIKDGMKVENISLAYGNNCIKYVLIMYGPIMDVPHFYPNWVAEEIAKGELNEITK